MSRLLSTLPFYDCTAYQYFPETGAVPGRFSPLGTLFHSVPQIRVRGMVPQEDVAGPLLP